ncbi:MAG: hypothetical protein JWM24_1733 [Solirubrobacterales bacterium]|nr:hypothetical protein [Solirubrobacterales bacterium]
MRSSGKREDLRAGVDGKQFRVAPALALERGSEILSGAVSRMERENATVEGDERQVIVIPDISQEDEAPGGNPKIVTLLNLRKILEEA